MTEGGYRKLAEDAAARALSARDDDGAGDGDGPVQGGQPGLTAVAYALLEVADAIRAHTARQPQRHWDL